VRSNGVESRLTIDTVCDVASTGLKFRIALLVMEREQHAVTHMRFHGRIDV